MSSARVLSAAAALRDFDLDQVAAFCDEPPAVIRAVLHEAADCIARSGPDGTRWQVVDRAELRRRIRAAEPAGEQVGAAAPRAIDAEHRAAPADRIAVTRLDYAEQVLLEWDEDRPYAERRLQLIAASNALRQALAALTPTDRPWWQLEVRPGELEDPVRPGQVIAEDDAATLTRLELTVEVAFLTRQSLVGRAVSTPDLVAASRRMLARRHTVDLRPLCDLVTRFVDLMLDQATPTEEDTAPTRLLAALARRRVRDLAGRSLERGLCALVPLLENVGRDGDPAPELYEELADLPSGRKHVVVYTDLLAVLPEHFRYREQAVRLPGTLTEAIADADTSLKLRRNAARLERDLSRSPYPSDRALIGSAVYTLQELTEREAPSDSSLRSRSDARCTELLRLATAGVP